MGSHNSLRVCVDIVATLLSDLTSDGIGYTHREAARDLVTIEQRLACEKLSFLTKTLPRLAKALDRGLAGDIMCASGFRKIPGSQLPKFLGTLFTRVFTSEGILLDEPCVRTVRHLRTLLYLFYKYEVEPGDRCDRAALDSFVETELEVARRHFVLPTSKVAQAQKLLQEVLSDVNLDEIVPRHGPGAVSGKETHAEKYDWTYLPESLTSEWDAAEFYFANASHFADEYRGFIAASTREPSARVLLVPKDSRGPRVISCEPKEYQWLQQGIMRLMVPHIERHPLTRNAVRFTDQSVNQFYALIGSKDGYFATLDLKEASDRVSRRIVRALFPPGFTSKILACSSRRTVLPDGRSLTLDKFAPMGSALCFPIMALTIWAWLRASGIRTLHVYGDDLIVERAQAHQAMSALEEIGLKVNLHKSCVHGLFRESCGLDALLGQEVTPVRIRTVWTDSPAYSHLASWCSYTNALALRGYAGVASYLAARLEALYGSLPRTDMDDPLFNKKGYPCLSARIANTDGPPRRYNPRYQRMEVRVWVGLPSRVVYPNMKGYHRLLRYFTEGCGGDNTADYVRGQPPQGGRSTNEYTRRGTMKIVRRWRPID